MNEWITSSDLINIRICKFIGKINRLSTSNNRNKFKLFKSINIKESKFTFLKSEISYLQYHWCPILLIDKIGLYISSDKYKIFNEGIDIKINT